MTTTLSPEDARLFFALWFPLLDYVNEEDPVFPDFRGALKSRTLDYTKAKILANRIWDDPSILDDYAAARDDLPGEHRELILSWKRVKREDFFLERHLKSGSVFISTVDGEVYLVKGLTDPWETLLQHQKPPMLLGAALLPFRDCIISDGLVSFLGVFVGKQFALSLKNSYMDAKRGGRIHTTL